MVRYGATPAGVGAAAQPRAREETARPEGLHRLYERYCEMEAQELLALMPQDGRRAFYRRARAWAGAGDVGGSVDDPVRLARRYARSVLPLPPYGVWLQAYLKDRRAYLKRLGVPPAPRLEEPVAVALRTFDAGWYAALCLSADAGGWKGFLRFHRSESARSWRTGDIFRGEDVEEIRDRFDAFDVPTLQAFLRSVLP